MGFYLVGWSQPQQSAFPEYSPNSQKKKINGQLSCSPSLNRLIKHNGHVLRSETVGNSHSYNRSWAIPVLNVEVIKNHVLGNWDTTWIVLAGWVVQRGVVQMGRDKWRLSGFIFISCYRVVVAWIGWSWNFETYDADSFLQHELSVENAKKVYQRIIELRIGTYMIISIWAIHDSGKLTYSDGSKPVRIPNHHVDQDKK